MSQETPRVHIKFKTFEEGGVRPFNIETNKKNEDEYGEIRERALLRL